MYRAHVEPTNGRAVGRPGGGNTKARLSEKDVRVIRALCRAGRTQASVAAQYGVSAAYVSRLVRHLYWAHVA
jgi:hypothetical protein